MTETTQNTTPVRTRGVHHVGLTVPEISATRDFFVQQLGFTQVGERPEYPAVFVSDGAVMLTLWQCREPESALGFDRHRNVGLHHLALAVEDRQALAELHAQLAELPAVELEFSPEPLGATGLQHMMCTVPGGIRVEFVAQH